MNNKYPVYWEVEVYGEDGNYQEGGILFATDWDDAARQIREVYEDDLLMMKIEMFDTLSTIFPIEKARQVREMIADDD